MTSPTLHSLRLAFSTSHLSPCLRYVHSLMERSLLASNTFWRVLVSIGGTVGVGLLNKYPMTVLFIKLFFHFRNISGFGWYSFWCHQKSKFTSNQYCNFVKYIDNVVLILVINDYNYCKVFFYRTIEQGQMLLIRTFATNLSKILPIRQVGRTIKSS